MILYHVMKYPFTLLFVTLLSACGGGGGSSLDTGSHIIQGVFSENKTVTLTSNYNVTNMITTTVADINGDGKDDLILHLWTSLYFGQQVGNIPCPNEVRILTYQSNGSFKDETSTFIIGSTDLGGCSRKMKVADINNDGKPDIVYAINQEDGRLQNNNSTAMNAQLAALVSVGNKYVVTKFGTPSWYHSVGVGKINNQVFVTGFGFNNTTPEAYTFDINGIASQYNISLPNISPNTFEFQNDILIQTGQQMLDIESYQYVNGNWTSTGTLPVPYNKVAVIQFYAYTGEGPYNAEVLDVGNNMYALTKVGNAITESCKMPLKPNEDPVVIMKMEAPVIRNYQPGTTSVVHLDDPNSSMPGSKLTGAKVMNSQIQKIDLNITNEQILNTNANFIECKDVNGDGYHDLIVYPYNTTGMPYVYINNKNYGFNYLGQSVFPAIPENWGNTASSILHDFDKDGISDLVVFPANGVSVRTFNYLFYSGKKLLN